MKRGEDFRNDFPDVDVSFRESVNMVLQGLREEKVCKDKRVRFIVITAIVLMLMIGVSVAVAPERWSLSDFIPTGRVTATEDEWNMMIAAFEPVTADANIAKVTVREALFDGYALYIVADIEPNRTSDFFVPQMCDLEAAASKAASVLPKDMSLREYIQSQGYAQTFEVSIHTGLQGLAFMPEMQLNEDGSLTFYYRQRLQKVGMENEQLEITLHVSMYGTAARENYFAEIPLTIKKLPVLEKAVSEEGEIHEFVNSGVVLSNLSLVRTALSTYVTADVQIVNDAAYSARTGNFVFNFCGPDGMNYDVGPFNMMGFVQDAIDRKHKSPLYYVSTLTMTELPSDILMIESKWGEYDLEKATDIWDIRLQK